ncbi:hypothetical protein COLO4_12124 [Corchorus olitorius]|uniref:Uncharacterized protein n=1 Tax=Corchorus olitorius TaxID=93759 RepID=A0A1R3K263_9ROSI|nr:hypothetical protein COLO4_12124 [Corchorus olitorius]
MKMIKNYLNYGIRNKESVAELFVTLLIKLASVENLWQKGVCVSLCRGSWISKALGFRCTINVEDFTDQYENVSRAVGREGFEKIYGCIRRSLHYLEAFSNGQMQISKLKELLFDRDTIGDRVAMDLFKTTAEINSNEIKTMKLTEKQSKTQLVHNESSQTKKRVFAEDLDKSKGKKQCKGVTLLEGKGGVQFKEVGRKQPVENEVKPLLISRDTIGSNIATHLVKTTTNSSVSNKSDEKNKTKLTEHLGPENQSNGQLVHHGSSQTKKRPFTEDLDKSKGKKQCKGANYVEGKGGVQFKEGGNKQPVENEVKPLPISRDTIGDSVATNHVKITTKVSVPNNSNEIKTELTENLGMVHQTKTQLGHHESSQTEKRPFKDDLGKSKGKKHCKGAKPLERKGGVQIKEGGKKQPVENEVKPLPTSGWQGKHPVDGRREWKTFGENSGHLTTHFAPQVPHLAPHSHSSDSLSCYDPVMFPSISASSFTHLQGFCNPIQQHPLFPLLNSLGLNASYILTPPAPMPHIGPIHGQHAQNQTHTVPRRPWE